MSLVTTPRLWRAAQRLAEREHQRRLAAADRAADADGEAARRVVARERRVALVKQPGVLVMLVRVRMSGLMHVRSAIQAVGPAFRSGVSTTETAANTADRATLARDRSAATSAPRRRSSRSRHRRIVRSRSSPRSERMRCASLVPVMPSRTAADSVPRAAPNRNIRAASSALDAERAQRRAEDRREVPVARVRVDVGRWERRARPCRVHARPCTRLARLATGLRRNASQRSSMTRRGSPDRRCAARTKGSAAVSRLRDRVAHERRQRRRVHLALLPRRLEPARVREPPRGRPSRRVAKRARLIVAYAQSSNHEDTKDSLRTRNTSAPAAAPSPAPISAPRRPR